MSVDGLEPVRIKLNGIDGGGATEGVRGYQRKTNRLPYPHISKELSFQGKLIPARPMSSARLFRAWRWTAGGPWRVPCALLLLNAMPLKISSTAPQFGKRVRRTSKCVIFDAPFANGRTLAAILQCYSQPDMHHSGKTDANRPSGLIRFSQDSFHNVDC